MLYGPEDGDARVPAEVAPRVSRTGCRRGSWGRLANYRKVALPTVRRRVLLFDRLCPRGHQCRWCCPAGSNYTTNCSMSQAGSCTGGCRHRSSHDHADGGADSDGLNGACPPGLDLGLQAASPSLAALGILEGRVLGRDLGDALRAEWMFQEHLDSQATRMAIDAASGAHHRVMDQAVADLALRTHIAEHRCRRWAHNPRDRGGDLCGLGGAGYYLMRCLLCVLTNLQTSK